MSKSLMLLLSCFVLFGCKPPTSATIPSGVWVLKEGAWLKRTGSLTLNRSIVKNGKVVGVAPKTETANYAKKLIISNGQLVERMTLLSAHLVTGEDRWTFRVVSGNQIELRSPSGTKKIWTYRLEGKSLIFNDGTSYREVYAQAE